MAHPALPMGCLDRSSTSGALYERTGRSHFASAISKTKFRVTPKTPTPTLIIAGTGNHRGGRSRSSSEWPTDFIRDVRGSGVLGGDVFVRQKVNDA